MPARVKKLILPKKFSLIKQELPRVIQDGDGKRYVEELDDKGESFPNALFESGDGDIRMAGGLELEAASERRRAVEPAPTVPNPENQVAIQLSNARSENEELHSQIAQLLSSSDGSEIAQLRRELQASQSTVAVHVDRIATLEAENNRLSALSDGQEFSRLRSALEESERNVNLLERAAGNSGMSLESVVAASGAPVGDEREQLVAQLNAATDPLRRGEIAVQLREFDARQYKKT